MTDFLVIRTVVGISFLVFLAVILGAICSRFRVPAVVGEITAGAIFGPMAFGQFMNFLDGPLIELNVIFNAFSEIGGIVILFAAGLEFTLAEFRAAGKPSFVVAATGVITPFFLGYYVSLGLGYGWEAALLIGAALTATSIAVSVSTLEEVGRLNTDEAKITINAAIIDDVLGLSVLSVVVSIVQAGTLPSLTSIFITTVSAIGLWLVLLISSAYVLPYLMRIVNVLKSPGTVEAAATASCFGLAALATLGGLSPIVGAFAAGMAIAGSKGATGEVALKRVREYVGKLRMIFGPLFFAAIGAHLNPGEIINVGFVTFMAIFVIAVFSKIVGCGLPAAYFLKSKRRGLTVGIGMTSRGEVGLIVAGIGLTSGVIGASAYAALIAVVIATTILTPFMLRRVIS